MTESRMRVPLYLRERSPLQDQQRPTVNGRSRMGRVYRGSTFQEGGQESKPSGTEMALVLSQLYHGASGPSSQTANEEYPKRAHPGRHRKTGNENDHNTPIDLINYGRVGWVAIHEGEETDILTREIDPTDKEEVFASIGAHLRRLDRDHEATDAMLTLVANRPAWAFPIAEALSEATVATTEDELKRLLQQKIAQYATA